MTPAPSRATTAGRAYNDLRNLARREGRDPGEFLVLYALEGFLTRLTVSKHASHFVLKGGVLLSAFTARRATRDIDLAANGIDNDITGIEHVVRRIIATHIDDGLEFDSESVASESIRDDTDYPGARISLAARLATARIALHIDVNFGDPIWPAPASVELPLLLGGTLELRGYPDHMVLAEKIVTAIARGDQNTRWRDFVDIATIVSTIRVRHADLRTAIEIVAEYRQVPLQPLGPLLERIPDRAQTKWSAWRRKQRLEATTPEQLGDLLAVCTEFTDPVLEATADSRVWDPSSKRW